MKDARIDLVFDLACPELPAARHQLAICVPGMCEGFSILLMAREEDLGKSKMKLYLLLPTTIGCRWVRARARKKTTMNIGILGDSSDERPGENVVPSQSISDRCSML